MYLRSALRVIAFGRWPYQVKLVYNGEEYQQKITLFTAANGILIGGGFFPAPQAMLDDGLLDIYYASRLSKFAALKLL